MREKQRQGGFLQGTPHSDDAPFLPGLGRVVTDAYSARPRLESKERRKGGWALWQHRKRRMGKSNRKYRLRDLYQKSSGEPIGRDFLSRSRGTRQRYVGRQSASGLINLWGRSPALQGRKCDRKGTLRAWKHEGVILLIPPLYCTEYGVRGRVVLLLPARHR